MGDFLPLQNTATGRLWSLARDTQFADELEAGLEVALGSGVVSGGGVTKTAALSVQVTSGTVFFSRGVRVTLSSAAAYPSVPNSPTVTLWGRILRTAPDYTLVSALATYALEMNHTTDGSTPAGTGWFKLAVIRVSGGSITSIDQAPPGKFVRATAPIPYGKLSVAASEVAEIPSGYGAVLPKITVAGTLRINGTLRIG